MDSKSVQIGIAEYVSIIYGTSRSAREAKRLFKELADSGLLQFFKRQDRLFWMWTEHPIEDRSRFGSHAWQVWDVKSRAENLEMLRRVSAEIERYLTPFDEELPF